MTRTTKRATSSGLFKRRMWTVLLLVVIIMFLLAARRADTERRTVTKPAAVLVQSSTTHPPIALLDTSLSELVRIATPLCAVTGGPPACAAWTWALSADGSVGTTQTPYTLVLGVQSTDNLRGRRMRPLHRTTWMTDANVARRANNFQGRVLVLAVLAEHHTRAGRGPSDALRGEAETAADILWLRGISDPPLCEIEDGEGCGIGRKRGFATEFTMSRKVATWFAFAHHQFPDAAFIGKSDDDSYLRPQLILRHLEELATLTKPVVVTPEKMNMLFIGHLKRKRGYISAWGMLYVFGHQAVTALLSSHPGAMRLLSAPFDRSRTEIYREYGVVPEDFMVGRYLFRDKRHGKPFPVTFDLCYMPDFPYRGGALNVTAGPICVHHVFPENMIPLHEQMTGVATVPSPHYRVWTTRAAQGLVIGCP